MAPTFRSGSSGAICDAAGLLAGVPTWSAPAIADDLAEPAEGGGVWLDVSAAMGVFALVQADASPASAVDLAGGVDFVVTWPVAEPLSMGLRAALHVAGVPSSCRYDSCGLMLPPAERQPDPYRTHTATAAIFSVGAVMGLGSDWLRGEIVLGVPFIAGGDSELPWVPRGPLFGVGAAVVAYDGTDLDLLARIQLDYSHFFGGLSRDVFMPRAGVGIRW